MDPAAIASTLDRNVRAVTLRPSVGQGTAVTKATLREGLSCDIQEGSWRLVAGMTEKYGGTNAGPNPGVYGRAALASCLALGYAMWAARLGIQIDHLEIEVQADYDVRGELGVADDVRPGYSQIRYIVTVSSPAPEPDIARWLDTADRYSSWRDNIANAVPLTSERRVTSSSTANAAPEDATGVR
jgi:uncharacterized OsmC-like protein